MNKMTEYNVNELPKIQLLKDIGKLPAAILLALYSAAIAANLARGRRHIGCGCLGPVSGRGLTGWLVVRNVVLIACSAAVWLPSTKRSLVWVDGVTLCGTLLVLAFFWIALNRLAACDAQRQYARRLQ